MNFNDFKLTTEWKTPGNTLGVSAQFYFGSIDGVEIGSPCDTQAEAIQNVKDILTRTSPFTIEECLAEDIDWVDTINSLGNRPDLVDELAKRKLKCVALLEKVKKHKATAKP
ncbi:hypothetical protein [Enterovibrio norvegicus]|uniref:hypothetical protein n=1 Tax=Enterovibrio norvegicus TaxID=188144 RepID=UPI00352F3CA2